MKYWMLTFLNPALCQGDGSIGNEIYVTYRLANEHLPYFIKAENPQVGTMGYYVIWVSWLWHVLGSKGV